jgi:UDP-glucose 4-epimerase
VDLAEGHVRALQHVLAPDRSVNTRQVPETGIRRGRCQSSAACPGSGQVSEYRTGRRDYVYVGLEDGHVRALQHVLAPDRSVNTGQDAEIEKVHVVDEE